jgi:hypothetical protein
MASHARERSFAALWGLIKTGREPALSICGFANSADR